MATKIGKRYTGEFNAEAVEPLPSGGPFSEGAVELGIRFDFSCRWKFAGPSLNNSGIS